VKGRNAVIAYVGKGEIVGEMSLLESQPASATLCAISPVTVLRIPRDALEENLAADPGFIGRGECCSPIAFARRSIRKRYARTQSTQGLLFIVPTRSTPKRPCQR